MNTIEIYIAISKESHKGLGYWVTLKREDGTSITPFMSYKMDHAIIEATNYANFFGLTLPKIQPIESMGLSQELIDAGYKDAEPFIEFKRY